MINFEEGSVAYKLYQNKILRYFFSAGVATGLDVMVYAISFNFIFQKKIVYTPLIAISPHVASLMISYSCGLITNFFIARYVVFSESTGKRRYQFSRFFIVGVIGFFANYSVLRLLVEGFAIWPTFARIISALSLGVLSFYLHKIFSFRIKKNENEPANTLQ